MTAGLLIELVKVLLPSCALFLFSWLFLRRNEQIKSEVASRSDFNQKWAALLFDATNEFMNTVEHIRAYSFLVTNAKTDKNGPQGLKYQEEINLALPTLIETRYRVVRLSTLVRKNGPSCAKAANDLYECIFALYVPKPVNELELHNKTCAFNQAVLEAHSEIIGSH